MLSVEGVLLGAPLCSDAGPAVLAGCSGVLEVYILPDSVGSCHILLAGVMLRHRAQVIEAAWLRMARWPYLLGRCIGECAGLVVGSVRYLVWVLGCSGRYACTTPAGVVQHAGALCVQCILWIVLSRWGK